jgi:hypothetical protein
MLDSAASIAQDFKPLTFDVYESPDTPPPFSKALTFQSPGLVSALVDDGGAWSGANAQYLRSITAPVAAGKHYIVASNGSWRNSAGLKSEALSAIASDPFPFPNPAVSGGDFSRIHFAKYPDPDASAAIEIYSEAGRRIHSLRFPGSLTTWSWDMMLEGGKPIPPGLYYYRVDRERAKPFVVLASP